MEIALRIKGGGDKKMTTLWQLLGKGVDVGRVNTAFRTVAQEATDVSAARAPDKDLVTRE